MRIHDERPNEGSDEVRLPVEDQKGLQSGRQFMATTVPKQSKPQFFYLAFAGLLGIPWSIVDLLVQAELTDESSICRS